MITEIAPAKINLYLHVGGLRPDRLHDLASLFVFADDGDRIDVEPADDLSLDIKGPFAGPLLGEPTQSNLVMRAARRLRDAAGVRGGARMTLDKRLPIASGLGGGSADAAAALRALIRLWSMTIDERDLRRLAFSLGADVPACLDRRPVEVTGAGEKLSPGPRLPPLWVCLCNPGVAMPTGPVFRAFDARHPCPPPPAIFRPAQARLALLPAFFAATRNDLEAVAIARRPVIQTVIDRLKGRPGAIAARMSGSGASVFGLFSSAVAAQRAATVMRGEGWWSMSARLYE